MYLLTVLSKKKITKKKYKKKIHLAKALEVHLLTVLSAKNYTKKYKKKLKWWKMGKFHLKPYKYMT